MQPGFDIGIIGGGLAGLSLSILAADAGHSVVLFEKETYPFHKVCGEYISLESYDFLCRLGLPLHDWDLPVITKLLMSDAGGRAYHFNLDLGGFGISRFTIDEALYRLAIKKGVEVHTNTKVDEMFFEDELHFLQASKKTFSVRTAVGAFGKRSNLDIKWKRKFTEEKTGKLNNYVGVKYHVRWNSPKDEIALHNFEGGYCGTSGIEDDKYCLCYLTTANNLARNNNSIQEMERNVLHKNRFLKSIFNEAEFLYPKALAISQISFARKTQVENHTLLLGDAAGMITPLCGNGMSMAMHSALLAATEIDKFLRKKISRAEMERNYIDHWKEIFSSRLATGRIVQRFMGNNSTAVFLKLMSTVPMLSKKVIRSTHGKVF